MALLIDGNKIAVIPQIFAMKLYTIIAVILFITACGDAANTGDQNTTTDTSTSTQMEPTDTTRQPSGMDNSSAISTDTAAMNVQNTVKKADSIQQQKNK